MTPDQFYKDHSWLVVSYKRAYLITRKRDNFDSYVMAGYIYDLISRLSPVFNPFDKRKPEPMLEKPFDLFGEEAEKQEKSKISKAYAFMETYAARHNVAMVKKDKEKLNDPKKRGGEK